MVKPKTKTPSPTIEATPNGPFIIRNMPSCSNSKFQKIPVKSEMAFCRCGGSNTKPFCDGTHGKIHFDDSKSPDRNLQETKEFKGKDITVIDTPKVCSHAGYCTDYSSDVFWTFQDEEKNQQNPKKGEAKVIDKERRRIAHPDQGNAEKTISTIKLCPSGALAYKIKNKVYDKIKRQPHIFVSKNGPYFVTGSPKLITEDKETPQSSEHYTLCRCGLSKNKPFCDGAHRKKFTDNKN